MNYFLKAYRIIILGLVVLSFTACESEKTCTDNMVSRVNAGLYTLVGENEAKLTVSLLNLYEESRPDSVLQVQNAHIFDFPLSMHKDSSKYILSVDAKTDTIELFYTSKLVWISTECGFTANFTLSDVTHNGNLIDSVSIVKHSIDLTDVENLKLFH